MPELKSLYICRPVLNADEIISFYKVQGFEKLSAAEDMHVTVIYSKTPVDWQVIAPISNNIRITGGENRRVIPLGDGGAIVLTLTSAILSERWKQLVEAGAKSDYPEYKAHVTLTWTAPDVDLSTVKPYEGQIVLGPEKMEEIINDWRPTEKSLPSDFILDIPLFVKAYSDSDGSRKISFEASNESVDGEGDVILRSALLDSAESFLKGTIDLDHLSEVGGRYGLESPQQYIVGRPLRVFALDGHRTGVEAELFKGNLHADKIWAGLQEQPPQPWRASIYGFPVSGGLKDVRVEKCENSYGATRYLVSKIHWKSTALTLRPVNDAITGTARIIKSNVFATGMQEIIKSYSFSDGAPSAPILNGPASVAPSQILHSPPAMGSSDPNVAPNGFLHPPRNRVELLGHHSGHMAIGKCAAMSSSLKKSGGVSVASARQHFEKCCGMDTHSADISALALLHLLKRH